MKKCTFISFLLSLTIACGSTSCARQTTTQTHTIKDNGITITWIQDNATPKTMPASLFSQEAQAVIDSLGMKESGIPSTISSFLVQVGGKNILFDTGLGLPDSRLLKALQSLQISPNNIQYIFLTHFHGDHIGGLLTNKGETVFKQAQIYAARAEYEGWMKMPQNQRTQIEKNCISLWQPATFVFLLRYLTRKHLRLGSKRTYTGTYSIPHRPFFYCRRFDTRCDLANPSSGVLCFI